MNSNSDAPLALDEPHYRVSAPKPFDELVVALCASASRYVKIISPTLDHHIFDNQELADILSALARRGSQSRVDILISDSRPIVQRGHKLLHLARRIPSSVSIRKLEDHPEMTGETIVIRDLNGVMFLPDDEGLGFYQPDSPSSAAPYLEKFEPLWQRAVIDPEFRQLGL